DVVHRAIADAIRQRLQENGTIEPQQTAHAEEREPHADLNSRSELGGDDDEEREAFGSVGHAGGDEPDGSDGEEIGDHELENAGVFFSVEVEVEVPATLHGSGVYGQTDAVRRLKADAEIQRTEIAARRIRKLCDEFEAGAL